MTTTEVKVKIRADDREASRLGKTLGRAFDPRNAKELRGATRDLERQLAQAARAQADLVKQMAAVKRGSQAFKDLKSELKGVKDQADLASKALLQIDQSQRRIQQHMRSGVGRNLAAGLGQGLGVAQYIPTDAGMGARMGGALLGGGIRRAGRMAAAPFMMPGIGGIAQGLSQIPIVGEFAGGAFQTAAGAVQNAVAFDRQRLQMMAYGGGLGRRMQFAAGAGAQRAQAAAQASAEIQPQRTFVRPELSPEAAQRAAAAQQALIARGVPIRKGQPIQIPEGVARTPETVALVRQASRGLGKFEVSEAEQRRVDSARAARRAQLTPTAPSVALPGAGFGVRFGLGPQQMMQSFGGFMQARGGQFTAGARSEFQTALAAQNVFGVGAQQAGAFARMGVAGGGGRNMGPGALAEVLQGAFVQGLRGSQVPEYLQTLVGLGQTSERQGLKLDPQAFQHMTMRVGQAGLQGLQAQRVTGGLVQAAQGLSGRGAQGPMDVLLMRAAGFQPGGGLGSYAKAMERLESPDEGLLSNVLSSISTGTEGFGKQGRGFIVKRALGALGISVSQQQARGLVAGFSGGARPDISGLLRQRGVMGGAEGLQAAGVSVVPGTARTAAGLEATRVGVGRKMAPVVMQMESNALEAAKVIGSFAKNLQNLNALVEKAVKGMQAITEGGAEGIVGRLKETGLDLAREYLLLMGIGVSPGGR